MTGRRREYLFIVVATVLWGTVFPATKLIVAAVDPLIIAATGLGIGALLGFGILAAMRRLDVRSLREPFVWASGC